MVSPNKRRSIKSERSNYLEKKWNGKRIAALIGVVILVSMYVISLIFAILAKPEAMSLFMGSLACTIFIPIAIYVYIWLYNLLYKKKDGEVTLREMKKLNRRIEQGESPEKIQKELEQRAKNR